MFSLLSFKGGKVVNMKPQSAGSQFNTKTGNRETASLHELKIFYYLRTEPG